MSHYHRHFSSSAVALGLFGIQIFSSGYFFGSQRGLQLAIGTVAFNSYAYRGLVKNELTSDALWGCPQGRYSDILQVSLSCTVSDSLLRITTCPPLLAGRGRRSPYSSSLASLCLTNLGAPGLVALLCEECA